MAMMSPSSGGGRGRRRSQNADINVTPMVDVMLVLLVIFMVTAPMVVTGEPVNLAKTNSKPLPPSEQQSLALTVNAAGQMFIGSNTEPVAAGQLGAQLIAIAKNGYEDRVLVRGDKAADYGQVLSALSLVRDAGFTNVGLVTDSTGTRKAKGN
ncbi:ExbD/TolR family protein [Hirschia litorea]|uniref:ExbD/TolR family protein n=1 Tax=Hirschia litorea TaxID=1199156 RepID=A0ABW2IKH2_9PROT